MKNRISHFNYSISLAMRFFLLVRLFPCLNGSLKLKLKYSIFALQDFASDGLVLNTSVNRKIAFLNFFNVFIAVLSFLE